MCSCPPPPRSCRCSARRDLLGGPSPPNSLVPKPGSAQSPPKVGVPEPWTFCWLTTTNLILCEQSIKPIPKTSLSLLLPPLPPILMSPPSLFPPFCSPSRTASSLLLQYCNYRRCLWTEIPNEKRIHTRWKFQILPQVFPNRNFFWFHFPDMCYEDLLTGDQGAITCRQSLVPTHHSCFRVPEVP